MLVAPSRASSSRPMSNVAGVNWCHRASASGAGIRGPRGSATSGATGIASESPWRASAVSRHSVARGALTAMAMRSVSAGSAPAFRYSPRLIAATRPPLVSVCSWYSRSPRAVAVRSLVLPRPSAEHVWQRRAGRHQGAQGIERVALGPSWNDAGLVFTCADGRPLRPEHATRHFQAIAERAGLPAIRLYDLRHTSASLALAAGVEMKVVSDRLGHSQISTTVDLYTHVSRGLGRATAEQIAGVLKTPNRAVPTASLPRTPENSPQKGD